MKTYFILIFILMFTNIANANELSGCEEVTIAGNTYYSSWSGTTIETGEGSCDDDLTDAAVNLLAIGAIYWAVSSLRQSEDDVEAFVSYDKVGFEFVNLPNNYFLRLVTVNKLSSVYQEHTNTVSFGNMDNAQNHIQNYQFEFGKEF